MAGADELREQVKQLGEAAVKAVEQARTKAGEAVHAKRGQIDSVIEKATASVNDRTGGSHAATLDRLKQQLAKGVDLVESQRHARSHSGPHTPRATSDPAKTWAQATDDPRSTTAPAGTVPTSATAPIPHEPPRTTPRTGPTPTTGERRTDPGTFTGNDPR